MDIEKERSLFEEWAIKTRTWNAHGLRKLGQEYIEGEVSDQWHVWQASAARATERVRSPYVLGVKPVCKVCENAAIERANRVVL